MVRNSTREEFSMVGFEDGGWGTCSKEFGRLLEAESSPQPTAGKKKWGPQSHDKRQNPSNNVEEPPDENTHSLATP